MIILGTVFNHMLFCNCVGIRTESVFGIGQELKSICSKALSLMMYEYSFPVIISLLLLKSLEPTVEERNSLSPRRYFLALKKARRSNALKIKLMVVSAS